MNDNSTTVTKQETLAALRNPGELYVVMSGATRLPFVFCDEETYDDEVFLYYRAEDAQEKAKGLREKKYAAWSAERLTGCFRTLSYGKGSCSDNVEYSQ